MSQILEMLYNDNGVRVLVFILIVTIGVKIVGKISKGG